MLRKSFIAAPALTLALSFSGIAQAEIEPILTIGVEAGGDDLVTTTAEDLSAGGGLTLGAGISFSQADSALSYRAILHYRFNTVEFTHPDGDATFDTLPLELGLFNRWNRHEIGAGLSTHLSPSYEISSSNGFLNDSIDFDNATGIFLQYNYIFSTAETATFTTDTYIGFKITAMDYETANTSIDANSLGIYLGSKF